MAYASPSSRLRAREQSAEIRVPERHYGGRTVHDALGESRMLVEYREGIASFEA